MNIELMQILKILDVYLKLILFSWPAVFLIVSMFVLLRHREAINKLISRIMSVRKDGVEFYPSGPPDSKIGELTKEDEEFIKIKKDDAQKTEVALVDCGIASSLPGTVTFNFLEDWKLWFWIFNRERKKYRAYVKIKFITEGYEKELNEGYYGGSAPWNLNAFSGIRAPGLSIPDEIQKAADQRKKITVKIRCTVKDENDHLVEEKLPSVYAYEYEKNRWYLEP